jgi:hypothetical protein
MLHNSHVRFFKIHHRHEIIVTPMQSICDQLLHEWSANQRDLRRVKFVWVERDPSLIEHANFLASDAQKQSSAVDQTTPNPADNGSRDTGSIANQLLATIPPTDATDEELEQEYCDGGILVASDVFEDSMRGSKVPTVASNDPRSLEEGKKKPVQSVLETHVYLTGQKSVPETLRFAQLGRPNLKAIFQEMKQAAVLSGDKKVAVCISAPNKLMKIVQKACLVYSDDKVRFDIHSESMGN